MKKYLLFLALLGSFGFAKAQFPGYDSSLPEGESGNTIVTNQDVIYITFSEPIMARVGTGTAVVANIGASTVYSALGKFWDDLALTQESKIIKINPLNSSQVMVLLDNATVGITYNTSITFSFFAGFVVNVAGQQPSDAIDLYYKGDMPVIVYQDPSNGKDNVLTNDTIWFNYTAKVAFNTTAPVKLTVKNATTGANLWEATSNSLASIKVSVVNNRVFLKNVPLHVDSTYKVIISDGFFRTKTTTGWLPVTGVADGAWSFSTKEITSVPPFTPAHLSGGASAGNDLSITFSENIVKVGGSVVIRRFSDNSAFETIPISSCSVSGATLTIPHSTFASTFKYYVEMTKGCVKSSTTNVKFPGIYGNATWSFTSVGLNVWVGGTSTDFTDGANWSDGIYDALSPVVIGATNTCKITSSVNAPDVTVTSTGKLEISSSGTLNMTGKLKLESSALSNSSLINNGTINVAPTDVYVYQYAAATPSNLRKTYASPIVGATGNSVGTTGTIYTFNNSTALYETVSPAATWNMAVGYATYITAPLVFNGALDNSAEYNLTLNYTSDPGNGAIYSSPYNLFGNPYTAPLNWKSAWSQLSAADTTRVRQDCWIHREYGSWVVINGKSGTASDGGSSSIPRGHGFMLRAKPGPGGPNVDATYTIQIKKTQLSSETKSFLKAAEVLPTNIKISAISANYSSSIIYGFHPEALGGYDIYDSEAFSWPNTTSVYDDRLQIATYINFGGNPLAINTVPNFIDKTEFFVAYYVKNQGVYTIELSSLDPIFKVPNTVVTLTDNVLNSSTTMVEGDKYYFFTATTPAVVKDRFKITIETNVPNGITTPAKTPERVNVYYSNANIYVNLSNDELVNIDIYNINGTKVLQRKADGLSAVIPFSGNGVYVVTVVGKKSSRTVKIVANSGN